MLDRKPKLLLCTLTLMAALAAPPAQAFEAATTYQPIFETAAGKTITLTGHDLTIYQVIEPAV